MQQRIVIILNPKSGRRNAAEKRSDLDVLLKRYEIHATVIETTRQGEATDIARKAVSGGAEVVAAANEHGMAMVFTGMRHFKH